MTDLSIRMDAKDLMAAYAAAKGIPMAKVIRNAARDFARAAFYKTPTAAISKSDYFWYRDASGKIHYLHKRMVKSQSYKVVVDGETKRRKRWVLRSGKETEGKIHKVMVGKGWSKASWRGVFQALGLPQPNKPKYMPAKADTLSSLAERFAGATASATITDIIRFNRFGKGSDRVTGAMFQAGYARAAKKIMDDVSRMLRRAWRNGNASNAN
jgi:hypothetical protein